MVPEEKLPIYSGVLRVIVGLAMDTLARVGKEGVAAHQPLLMLDEAAALGYQSGCSYVLSLVSGVLKG